MAGSIAAALLAAVAFGVASLLQATGARRTASDRPVGLRLLGQFARQPAFLAGTALDAAGFVLTFFALRRLPLFAVEAAVSSAVAVTAVGSALQGGRLTRREWRAVGAIVAGLVLVGTAARPDGPPSLSAAGRLTLLAGAPALAAAGIAAGRRLQGRTAAAALGGVAGLAFALFSVTCRVVPASGLATDPLAALAVVYVALGVLLYGAALQRGPVTVVAAATAVVETLVPAAAGLALADGARAGLGPAAALGFAVTTMAALLLVRSPGTGRECPDFDPRPDISDISSSSVSHCAPLTGV